MHLILLATIFLLFIPIIYAFFIYHPKSCVNYENFLTLQLEKTSQDKNNILTQDQIFSNLGNIQYLNNNPNSTFKNYYNLINTKKFIDKSFENKTCFFANGIKSITINNLKNNFSLNLASFDKKSKFQITFKNKQFSVNNTIWDFETFINTKIGIDVFLKIDNENLNFEFKNDKLLSLKKSISIHHSEIPFFITFEELENSFELIIDQTYKPH